MDMLKLVSCKIVRTCYRQRMPAGGCIIVLLLLLVISLHITGPKPWYVTPSLVSEQHSSVINQFEEISGTVDCESVDILPTIHELTEKHEESLSQTIFAITPTYTRLTQLLDLTSLCQTLMNVNNLIWVVIENTKTLVVKELLNRCTVQSMHVSIKALIEQDVYKNKFRTQLAWQRQRQRHSKKSYTAERNKGLEWIRSYCVEAKNCTGVVYFLDDENKYDLRLFQQIRQVKYVGVWPVAYAGHLKFEGPVCVNGTIVEWHAAFRSSRTFPINVAGFAINVQGILAFSEAKFGLAPGSKDRGMIGWEESDFLQNFVHNISDPRIECRGSREEAQVWYVESEINPYLHKHHYKWKYGLIT